MKPTLTEVVLTCPVCGDSTMVCALDLSAKGVQYCRYRKSCKNYRRMMDWDSDYFEVVDASELNDSQSKENEDDRLSFRLQERIGQTYRPLPPNDGSHDF